VKAISGHVLWAAVTAAAVLQARLRVHWAADLAWAAALAGAGCALALRARRARERERDAEHRIAELEAQVGAYGKALTAMAAYGRCASPAARTAGGQDCPEPGAARLRLVPPQGSRR